MLPAVSIPAANATVLLVLLGAATVALLFSAIGGLRRLFAEPVVVTSAREAKTQRHAVAGTGLGRLAGLAFVALLAAEGFYAWKILSSRDSLAEFREASHRTFPAGAAPSEADLRFLAGKAGPAAGPDRIVLEAAAADQWLATHVRFKDAPSAGDGRSVVRTGVGVSSKPGRLAVAESVRWLGRDWLLTYEVPDPAPGVMEADVKVGVRLNGMPLPGRIGTPLWASLNGAFARAESERRQRSSYEFAGMTSRGFVWVWHGNDDSVGGAAGAGGR